MRDPAVGPPLAILLELTHRCACFSNPLALTPGASELSTADWCGMLDAARRWHWPAMQAHSTPSVKPPGNMSRL